MKNNKSQQIEPMCKHTSAISGPCSSYIGMRD
nr:MAG TPA: hypothetical protein [Caudoviricetes sp.]